MLLFLDFDGVLNKHFDMEWSLTFDAQCIKKLDILLLLYPDIKFVITSNWRNLVHQGVCNVEYFAGEMQRVGAYSTQTYASRIKGLTRPDKVNLWDLHTWTSLYSDSKAEVRRSQILDYLTFSQVEKYVIWDDLELNLPNQILTDSDTGITLMDLISTQKILGTKDVFD